MDSRVTILFSIDGYNILNRKPFVTWHTIDIVDAHELSKFPKFEYADVRMLSSSAEGTSLNAAFRTEVEELRRFSTREFVRQKIEGARPPRPIWLFGLSQIFVVFNDLKLAYKFEGSIYPESSSTAYQLKENLLFDADIVRPCIESARHHV